MQSLPSDLYAYTFKNPKKLDRISNTVAAVKILHICHRYGIFQHRTKSHLSLAGMMLTAGFYPDKVLREYY